MDKELKSLTDGLGESTIKSYEGSYKRLRKVLELTDKRKPIRKLDLKIILEKIDEIKNPSTRHSVMVITKKIFPYNDDNKELYDPIDERIKKDKRELQVAKNGSLDKELPSYKEIESAIKRETDPRKYITSFIMFRINTRNQDIALIDLHKEPKDEYDKERNHLILDGNKVIFLRNKYKTFKKYGVKKNTIVVKKFIDMVKKLLGDKDNMKLFSRKNGEKITESSIASYLKKYIVLGMNEGKIIKAVLKHAADSEKSYEKIRKISNNRGTTTQVLLSEYDISNVEEPSEIIKNDKKEKKD